VTLYTHTCVLCSSIVDLNIEPDDPASCGSENDYCCLHNYLSVPNANDPHTSKLVCGNHPVQSFNIADNFKYASIKLHTTRNVNGDHGFKLKYAIGKFMLFGSLFLFYVDKSVCWLCMFIYFGRGVGNIFYTFLSEISCTPKNCPFSLYEYLKVLILYI
jgi:hypothetical protein